MKHLMTLMALVVAMTAGSQNVIYNPDIDGDNVIGVSDILQLLTLFGTEGNGTGVWSEIPNWTNGVETYSCSDTMAVVANQEPKALIFYLYNSVLDDFATYMYENGANFFGFEYASFPENSYDIESMLSWPGWTNSPGAFVISADVPQVSGGYDSYGNGRVAHVFETVEITLDEPAWITVLVPQSLMVNSTSSYTHLNYDINGNQSACIGTEVSSTIASFLGCYTGPDFAHGHYRMYTSYSSPALNWPNVTGFIRGGIPSDGE